MSEEFKPNKHTSTGRYATSAGCARCELCLNLLPKVFDLDEEGRSFVKRQPITTEEHQKIHDAIENCPISGIKDYCPLNEIKDKEELK